ncbi:haloacid dehalogenase type II [Alkalicoccus chagannorensis]|uniref:haloacid dehalogenase type II n=1 Tax=Alkalicoccus chagannorensis TaxID=427072 RepID=UPI0006874032|nr:haloacid dehalogenase type II [Alkalicoccus chagannorensis]
MYKAVFLDAYGTLFDVRSPEKALRRFVGEQAAEAGQLWRRKQLDYAFTKEMTGQWEPLSTCTRRALDYVMNVYGIGGGADVRETLFEEYMKLEPFDESKEVLEACGGKAARVILSNGSYDMLRPLTDRSILAACLDRVLSVEEIRRFKPAPETYQFGLDTMQLEPEEVLFVSSNTWDITGAAAAGLDTLWINRSQVPFEQGFPAPAYEAASLHRLEQLLRRE